MNKELLILIIAVFLAGALAGRFLQPHKAVAQKEEIALPVYTLDNCITVFAEDKTVATQNGWAFWYAPKAVTGGLNLKKSYIKEGSASHAPHQHAEKEILYILDGTAEFNLNGATRMVGANTSLFCPPGIPHGIRNAVNDAPLSYLVIKDE